MANELTPAQLAAQKATIDRIKKELSILGKLPADITPEVQREYLQRLSSAIVASGSGTWSDTQIATAKARLEHGAIPTPDAYTVLDAASDFGGELATQAGEVAGAVGEVGKGVVNTLKLSSWLIPVVVIVWVALLIWRNLPPPPPAPSARTRARA